jgi:hypothetical protein
MAAWLLALWCNARTGYPRAIVRVYDSGYACCWRYPANSDYDRGRAKIKG